MPQIVVNMNDGVSNKVCSKLKNNRFKQRYAPYSNRWSTFGTLYKHPLQS